MDYQDNRNTRLSSEQGPRHNGIGGMVAAHCINGNRKHVARLLRRRQQQRDSCTSHRTGRQCAASSHYHNVGTCCALEQTASSCSHGGCGSSILRFSSSERPLDFSVTQLEEQTLLFLEGELRLSGNRLIAVERFNHRVRVHRVRPSAHRE